MTLTEIKFGRTTLALHIKIQIINVICKMRPKRRQLKSIPIYAVVALLGIAM
jgi:hypothetical protein